MIKNIILLLIIIAWVFLWNYGFHYYENTYLINNENNNIIEKENTEEKIKYLKSIVQNEEYVNKNYNWSNFTIDWKFVDYDIIGNNSIESLLFIIKDKESIFHDEVIRRIREM